MVGHKYRSRRGLLATVFVVPVVVGLESPKSLECLQSCINSVFRRFLGRIGESRI